MRRGRPVRTVSRMTAELMSRHQVAELWGLRSPRSVAVIAARRGITEVRLGHRTVRYRRAEIEALGGPTGAATAPVGRRPPAPAQVLDQLRAGPRLHGPMRRRGAAA